MWLIAGLIVGTGVLALVVWLRNNNIALKWYEWVIGVIGLLLLLFTVQNYFASVFEGEPVAANWFLLVTGLPSLVLVAIAAALIWRRQRVAA